VCYVYMWYKDFLSLTDGVQHDLTGLDLSVGHGKEDRYSLRLLIYWQFEYLYSYMLRWYTSVSPRLHVPRIIAHIGLRLLLQ